MLEKQELLAFIRQQKPELTDRFHLTKIGIFGSFARGEQTPESDIDLIVEFKPGTEDLFQLKRALRELFAKQFNKEVALCREKFIKSYYRKQILGDAIFV